MDITELRAKFEAHLRGGEAYDAPGTHTTYWYIDLPNRQHPHEVREATDPTDPAGAWELMKLLFSDRNFLFGRDRLAVMHHRAMPKTFFHDNDPVAAFAAAYDAAAKEWGESRE